MKIVVLQNGNGVDIRIDDSPTRAFSSIGDLSVAYAEQVLERQRLALAMERLASMLCSRTPDQATRLGYKDRLGDLSEKLRVILTDPKEELDFESLG